MVSANIFVWAWWSGENLQWKCQLNDCGLTLREPFILFFLTPSHVHDGREASMKLSAEAHKAKPAVLRSSNTDQRTVNTNR